MRVGLEPLNGRLWTLFDAPYLSQGQEEALVTTQSLLGAGLPLSDFDKRDKP